MSEPETDDTTRARAVAAIAEYHKDHSFLGSLFGNSKLVSLDPVDVARLTWRTFREQRTVRTGLLPGERGGPEPISLDHAMAAMPGAPYRGGGVQSDRLDVWSAQIRTPDGYAEPEPEVHTISGHEVRARCNQCSRTNGGCAGCGGSGRMTCTTCNGTGQIIRSGDRNAGIETCQLCDTTGGIACAMCNGTRMCSLCLGSTVLRVVPQLAVSWNSESVEMIVPQNLLPQSLSEAVQIEFLRLDSQSRTADIVLEGRSIVEALDARGGTGLGPEIDKLLRAASSPGDRNAGVRVIRQQVVVRRVRVWRAEYEAAFTKARVWLFGERSMQVFPEDAS
jgi:hypothetical protein